MSRAARTLILFVTSVLGLAVLTAAPAAAAGASVAITSPAVGATVSGVVQVAVSGTSGSADQSPIDVELFVDGIASTAEGCGAYIDPAVCVTTIGWDTTGVAAGTHTLQVRMSYPDVVDGPNLTVDSAVVSVTVSNASPTAVITSPASGARVSGNVPVTVQASVPAELSLLPKLVDLYVDGVWVDQQLCPDYIDPKVCPVAFSIPTSSLAGSHRLQAKLTVQDLDYYEQATLYAGPAVTVTVLSPAAVVFNARTAAMPGTVRTISGRVVATNTGKAIPYAKVVFTLTPAVGTRTTRTITATSKGTFAFTVAPRTNLTVSATTVAAGWWTRAVRSAVQPVKAPITCTLSAARVRVGKVISGVCYAKYLPAGTTVKLQMLGYTWTTIATGTNPTAGQVAFRIKPVNAGSSRVRIVAMANRVYTTTASPSRAVSAY